MDLSIFLAQAFGLYFIIMGLGMLFRWRMVKKIYHDLLHNKHIIFGAGIFALMLGIPLVLAHNIWSGGWPVVITVLVWITLLKGVINTFAPEVGQKWAKLLMRNESFVKTLLGVFVLFGFYLLILGFSAV